MDLRTKELLIEKYWNGSSTMEEEQQLKNACKTNPDIFTIEEQNLFSGILAIGELALPKNFTTEFLDNLEYEDAHERYAVTSEESASVVRKITWRSQLSRIAAAVILLIGLSVGYQHFFSKGMSAANLTPTERAAYEESQKALLLIAQKMDKVKLLSTAFEKFDDAQIKIRRK